MLNIRDRTRKATVPKAPHTDLELLYSKRCKFDERTVSTLAKKLELPRREIERWLRRRRSYDRPSTMVKFTESMWRGSFFLVMFCYGLWTLYDKKWFWDSSYLFIGYPHHSVSDAEWWYYNIELGFYLSLFVTQFFDIQRKDFWQMFVHHLATILLIVFSWACNLHRIGSLVLIIHDFADAPLEAAKIGQYTKHKQASDIIFLIFTICWILSRLVFFGSRVIIYSSYYIYFYWDDMFPAYYVFNFLLMVLQVLHIIWTFLIGRIAYNAIFKGGVKDLRESDESQSEAD